VSVAIAAKPTEVKVGMYIYWLDVDDKVYYFTFAIFVVEVLPGLGTRT